MGTPKLWDVVPSAAVTGGAALPFHVDGVGFEPGAVIVVNGVDQATTRKSGGVLTCTLTPPATNTVVPVVVRNPGGETSRGLTFTTLSTFPKVSVSTPLQRLGPIAPTGATAGAPGTWTPAGAQPAASLTAMSSVVANPATPWTTGQYVQTATPGAPGQCCWTGSAWVGGRAP